MSHKFISEAVEHGVNMFTEQDGDYLRPGERASILDATRVFVPDIERRWEGLAIAWEAYCTIASRLGFWLAWNIYCLRRTEECPHAATGLAAKLHGRFALRFDQLVAGACDADGLHSDHRKVMLHVMAIRRGEHPDWLGDPIANVKFFCGHIVKSSSKLAAELADSLREHERPWSHYLGISPETVGYYHSLFAD